MNLDKGKKAVDSSSGACCSLVLIFVILLYTYQKAGVLFNRKDFNVMQTVRDQAFTSDYVFSYEKGFNFAFAFTSFDNEKEWLLDPTYGEMVVKHSGWGVNSDKSVFSNVSSVETHLCSKEELGLGSDKSKSAFMPIEPASQNYVEIYQKKMVCLNKEDLSIFGSTDSENASLL